MNGAILLSREKARRIIVSDHGMLSMLGFMRTHGVRDTYLARDVLEWLGY